MGGLSSSGQVWVTRQAGEEDIEDCLVPKFKKLETLMVWACFKGRHKGPLIFWNKEQWGKTIKATSFTSHIVPHFFQFWQEQSTLQLDYVYLQQDGAGPHQAAHTQNHFRTLGIWGYFIDWPPSSPDCNPIENLWRTLKQHIRRRNPFPTTNTALRAAIEEEWAAITADELEALVDTVPTRLREVNTLTPCDQLLNTNKTILDRFGWLRVVIRDIKNGSAFFYFFLFSLFPFSLSSGSCFSIVYSHSTVMDLDNPDTSLSSINLSKF